MKPITAIIEPFKGMTMPMISTVCAAASEAGGALEDVQEPNWRHRCARATMPAQARKGGLRIVDVVAESERPGRIAAVPGAAMRWPGTSIPRAGSSRHFNRPSRLGAGSPAVRRPRLGPRCKRFRKPHYFLILSHNYTTSYIITLERVVPPVRSVPPDCEAADALPATEPDAHPPGLLRGGTTDGSRKTTTMPRPAEDGMTGIGAGSRA